MEETRCYDCDKTFKYDADYDVFKMKINWLDIFNHKNGYAVQDLGLSGVLCPFCGREIVLHNRGLGDTYIGPFDGNNIVNDLGADIVMLREYQELKHRFSYIDDEDALNACIFRCISL